MTAEGLAFDDAKARRNAMILATSQAIFGATATALVVTAGPVGPAPSPPPSLAPPPLSLSFSYSHLTPPTHSPVLVL